MENKASYWTDELKQYLKNGRQRVRNEPYHPLLGITEEYDRLEPDTLYKNGCGIVQLWNTEWLAIPYPTGCQLYRRQNGSKFIRSFKGSKPSETFFGAKLTKGRSTLLIAKSPRECMLLDQLVDGCADVIGLCSEVQGNLTVAQKQILEDLISKYHYKEIFTFLDCNTEATKLTAEKFTGLISSTLKSFNWVGEIKLVNISEYTEGAFNDISDLVRTGEPIDDFGYILSEAITVDSHITDEVQNGTQIRLINSWLAGKKSLDSQTVISLLKELDPLEYEQVRKKAASKLDFRKSALDELTKSEENSSDFTSNIFDEPEPWSQPIKGSELFKELVDVFERHIVFSHRSAVTCALWVIHTYTFELFQISPILGITSPVRRCGKTTLLNLLEALVYKPAVGSSFTAASLFRVVELFRPTLIIDEADTFLSDNIELRGVINSGHTKRSAYIWRCTGDNHEPTRFSTWAPKAIACIGELPGTIIDRAIEIKMHRKTASDKVKRLRERNISKLSQLPSKLIRWAQDNMETLKVAEPEIPESLSDRLADSWEPLLAIASVIGEDCYQEARDSAMELSDIDNADSKGTELLSDIQSILKKKKYRIAIFTIDLTRELNDLEERPWSSFNNGKGLTGKNIASILKPFGIKSKDIRSGNNVRKGYVINDFTDTFHRYLSNRDATSATSFLYKDLTDNLSATKTEPVADKGLVNALEDIHVAHVAD